MTTYLTSVWNGYENAAEGYASAWPEPHPWLAEERNRFLERLVPGASIIDVGCGPGHDVAYFSALGYRAIGVDNSEAMLAIAHRLHPGLDFQHGDIADGKLPSGPFDGAWVAYVLLHLPIALQSSGIQRVCSLVRPGGTVFIATATSDVAEEVNKPIAGLRASTGEELSIPSTRMPVTWLEDQLSMYGTIEWSKITRPLPDRGGALHVILKRGTETGSL